jgi:hypothetical protein
MTVPRARDLISSSLGGTPYLARALELLGVAEQGDTTESCAVWSERDGTVHAVALVGLVAGAVGAGKIHLAIGDDRHVVSRACDVLRALGARFALAEWPDDSPFLESMTILREEGFAEEARIPDFYRPGVALVFLRRDL